VGTDADLELADQIRLSSESAINERRADAIEEILVAETQAEFQETLAEQRAELRAVIQEVERERDAYRDQARELADENEELEAERDALLAERRRLREQLLETGGAEPDDGAPIEPATPLTGKQVEALIEERDQLAGDIVGLAMENEELRQERDALREQIEELRNRNTRLRDDVETMTTEVARLQELVQAYRETLGPEPGAARPEAPPAAPELPNDYVRSSDLEAAAQSVTTELQSLNERIGALERAASELAALEEAIRSGVRGGLPVTPLEATPPGELPGAPERGAPPADEDAREEPDTDPTDDARGAAEARAARERAEQAEELARVRGQLARLVEQNEALRTEQLALEERVLDEILGNGFVAIMKERLTRRLTGGFGIGTPDTGTWEVRPDFAVQTDPDAYFAKLAMPADQSEAPVLYSFTVRTLDDGWVGAGLHLFVDEVEKRRGYGMGSSLLVWFTRDPEHRMTQTTYLQLYRSDDDVSMARVLDAAVPHDLDDYLSVDVLYEPASQYITVAVNGTDRIRYRTWFGIDSGVELALRSLGRAEFRDFTVRTTPELP
jgi:cell division protein FtsB